MTDSYDPARSGTVTGIEGHGVALVILPDFAQGHRLFAQCECGWYTRFPPVITFAAVAESVNDHHGRVLQGVVR